MGGARAHAQRPAFKVPFDFTVGSNALPTGTYQVSRASGNAILIESKDGRFHAMTTTHADDKESYGGGKLIFARYGNQYFLHEVVCSDVSINVGIPQSKREKQARIQEAQLPRSETVAALRTETK
jgi:hypothetical protein